MLRALARCSARPRPARSSRPRQTSSSGSTTTSRPRMRRTGSVSRASAGRRPLAIVSTLPRVRFPDVRMMSG